MRLDSIKIKITSIAGVALLIVMAALITISGITLWNVSSKDSLDNAEALATGYSSRVQNRMNQSMVIARTMSTALSGLRGHGAVDRTAIDTMLQNILKDNPSVLASFSVWEPDSLDSRDSEFANTEGHDATGRYVPYWTRGSSNTFAVDPIVDYETNDDYQIPKRTGQEMLTNPYFYLVQGKKHFVTSLISPIIIEGKFVGTAGTDIDLNILQQFAAKQNMFDGTGELVIISNSGDIVAHSKKPELIGRKLSNTYPGLPELDYKIKTGTDGLFFNEQLDLYQIVDTIRAGNAPLSWSVMVTLPKSYITGRATAEVQKLSIIAVGLMALGLIGMWFVAARIADPMISMSKTAKLVADSSFQDLSSVTDGKKFSGELLDLHNGLKSIIMQAVDALTAAKANAQEAEEKASVAEEAVKESEQAKKEGEQAMQRGIFEAASRIQGIVERVSSATEQLSVQVEQSSKGAETQRDRMTDTATAMEEMNVTVVEVAKNASEAAINADSAMSKAAEGATIVNDVVGSITEINRQAIEMKKGLDELGSQAEGIGLIMEVISDIADQTNLLALNAAIEAARAGDAGRGFAVVADEVRKLAEKTMSATSEVGDAITSIQSGTKKNIASMEDIAVTVHTSTEQAQESGTSLTNIVSISESTADQVRAIATASEQQAATSEEISKATEEVTRISAETNDSMGQASSALRELSSLTGELTSIVREMQQQ